MHSAAGALLLSAPPGQLCDPSRLLQGIQDVKIAAGALLLLMDPEPERPNDLRLRVLDMMKGDCVQVSCCVLVLGRQTEGGRGGCHCKCNRRVSQALCLATKATACTRSAA